MAGRAWGRAIRVLAVVSCASFSGCLNFGGVNLAPDYERDEFIVPDSWRGSGPFVPANPSDGALRKDWWKLFDDPILDKLEQQAMSLNPDLAAAAERFVQSRDVMMKVRSQLIPHLNLGADASDNRQSEHRLFRPPDSPLRDHTMSAGGLASWEPDFWSEIRNNTRVQIYRAEQIAAQFALARLSIQAELASDYFELRALDARNAIYQQSIEYYEQSLEIVKAQFRGAIASELDVARAEYILASTQARQLDVQAKRQVIEHAIATLVNRVPAAFTIAPLDTFEVITLKIPNQLPSTLVERRPDVASMEREMAAANREIGIARAAFFPKISLHVGGGFEGSSSIVRLMNAFWSYGAMGSVPLFQGGYLRAQLQQAWSHYRETEDHYRATVLNAFREVEDGLSRTTLMTKQLERQNAAIAAATKQQSLSMELYKGGLATSLELISSQVNTLESRNEAANLKGELLRAMVGLVRALGGGFQNGDLPKDDEIQPFGVFQARHLDKPKPAGGIDVQSKDYEGNKDLSKPVP